MATIEDLKKWIARDFRRFSDEADCIERLGDETHTSADDPPVRIAEFRIYTDNNSYIIKAHEYADDDDGYLGCQASSRKPRAGESHTRGRDLHDGKLNEKAWHRILGNIVSFEMVKVHKPDIALTAVENPPAGEMNEETKRMVDEQLQAFAESAKPWAKEKNVV